MKEGPTTVRNLVNKFRDAAKQVGSVIIDGSKQRGFNKSIAETLKEVSRKGVSRNTTFRVILNDGSEIKQTIKATIIK